MSYFTTNMHQIRFRLGLRPRPRWGSLQHLWFNFFNFGALPNILHYITQTPKLDIRGLLLREGEGKGWDGTGRKGKGKEGRD